MPFVKGQTANPGGRGTEKPFLEAIRMEIAAAGSDHKLLRRIARKLLAEAENGNLPAIAMVADRLDGKPAQETNLKVTHAVSELSDDELIGAIDTVRTLLAGTAGKANGTASQTNGSGKPH